MSDFILKRARQLIDSGNYQDAVKCLEEYILEFPNNLDGYRNIADAYALEGNTAEDLKYRRRLIELGSQEPADYYDLSRICYEMGDQLSAVEYGKKCITLCEENEFYYYYQAANFWSTLALIALERYDEASSMCGELESGYKTHVKGKGMISKENLEDAIEKGLAKNSSKKKVWRFPED